MEKHVPGAKIEGILVEEMARKGVEVILGASRDARFGPLMMFGLGGTLVEVLKDVSFRLAPMWQISAERMVRQIRSFKVLDGFRGNPPSDIDAIVDTLLRLSAMVCNHPEISELRHQPADRPRQGQGLLGGRQPHHAAANAERRVMFNPRVLAGITVRVTCPLRLRRIRLHERPPLRGQPGLRRILLDIPNPTKHVAGQVQVHIPAAGRPGTRHATAALSTVLEWARTVLRESACCGSLQESNHIFHRRAVSARDQMHVVGHYGTGIHGEPQRLRRPGEGVADHVDLMLGEPDRRVLEVLLRFQSQGTVVFAAGQ